MNNPLAGVDPSRYMGIYNRLPPEDGIGGPEIGDPRGMIGMRTRLVRRVRMEMNRSR